MASDGESAVEVDRLRAVRLELPFPISVNQYYGTVRRGAFCKVYVTPRGKSYRVEVENLLESVIEPLRGRIHMKVALHAATRRKYDIDNPMKCLLDALTHAGVWEDDEQVDRLLIERGEKIKGGLAVVELEEVA